MDFFYKLFPYKSLVNIDNNTLTIWWVIFAILVFLVGVFHLIQMISKIKKGVSKSIINFPNIDKITDSALKSVWEEYKSTFIKLNGGSKTDEFASDYFNERNLISKKTNLKLLNSVPSILVGFGILGTFVGLTFGISNFKTSSTDEIKSSIEVLLSGMGTAFISSIYGMLLSLIFTVLEKIQTNRLHTVIHEYCYKVDKQFKITKDDERKIQLLQQEKSLTDIFYYKDENNHLIKPANIFRDIYEESRKQSQALQSFSTDLATKIDAGFESLLLNNQNGVIPELRLLKVEIENLGNKLQDPTTEMTQNVVKDLEIAMSKMIDEFKTSVSGTTKSELENLTTLLNMAGNSLIDFPSKMQLMTENLNQNFGELQKVVQEIAVQTLTQSEHSTDQMRKQVEEMSEILKNKVGDLQVGQEILINKQSENLQVSDKLLSAFNQSIEKMNSLSNEVTVTISEFSKVQFELTKASNELLNISKNVSSSSETFKESQMKFATQANLFIENNSKTLQEIQTSLSKAKEVSTDYAQKFTVIQDGLKSIFNQIQTGLNDYRDTIGESLEMFLGKYTESLTKTAESLAGAATQQEDILEELTEQLSKLNGKR